MQNGKRSFKDTKGREWHLSITALSAMKMRDELGVDINRVAAGDNSFLQELTTDTWKIVEVIEILTAGRRKELGIEREDFLESLADDVLDEATKAFIAALVNFTRPLARPAMQEVATQLQVATEKMGQKLADKIKKEMPSQLMGKFDKSLDELTFGE